MKGNCWRVNRGIFVYQVLEIPIIYEVTDDIECSPDYEYPRSGSGSRLDAIEGEPKKVCFYCFTRDSFLQYQNRQKIFPIYQYYEQ